MSANAEVLARLREFGPNIEKWRTAAGGFRQLADEAIASQHIDEGTLLEVERTASELYGEIATFNKLMPEIAATSPNAAGELAAVGEALQLVLLDITETGTRMYSARSALTQRAQMMPMNEEKEMPDKINSEAPPPPPPPAPHDPHPADEDAENVYNPSPGGDDRSEQKDRSIDRLRKGDPGSPA